MKIVLSIKPQYANEIIHGTKKFEYRKSAARQKASAIVIYITSPVKQIAAEVEILQILKMTPEEMWENTKQSSGIDKASFDEYFANRKVAYAYQLGKVTEYTPLKSLSEFGLKSAPRSILYIDK